MKQDKIGLAIEAHIVHARIVDLVQKESDRLLALAEAERDTVYWSRLARVAYRSYRRVNRRQAAAIERHDRDTVSPGTRIESGRRAALAQDDQAAEDEYHYNQQVGAGLTRHMR